MFALAGDLIYKDVNQEYFIWSRTGLYSSETHDSAILEVL